MKFYYLLHPRPVTVIGSGSIKNNEINFMTCSWITPISEDPPIVGFSSYKENYTNVLIEKYKQFSVNIISDVDLLWKFGITSGRDINKVEKFGVKYVSGKALDVPILKDSLGWLECRVINYVEMGEAFFYFGEVINWEAKEFDKYGWKDVNKIPLHKAGRAFAFPDKRLRFIR